MNDEAVAGPRRAFRRRRLLAAEIAEARRPGQRHDIVVELGGRDGRSGGPYLREGCNRRRGHGERQTQGELERETRHSNVLASVRRRSITRSETVLGKPLRLAYFSFEDRPDDLATWRIGECRVNADDAPFDAPAVSDKAELRPHGVDDSSLLLI